MVSSTSSLIRRSEPGPRRRRMTAEITSSPGWLVCLVWVANQALLNLRAPSSRAIFLIARKALHISRATAWKHPGSVKLWRAILSTASEMSNKPLANLTTSRLARTPSDKVQTRFIQPETLYSQERLGVLGVFILPPLEFLIEN
jgi:hypothetical protein